MSIQNKYAVVTGASTGIGRAIALELGKTGMLVGLVARKKEKLEETKKLIESAGGKASILPLDLTDISQIQTLSTQLKNMWGHVDILVNVAGIYHDKTKAHYHIPFTDYSVKEIKNTYEVGTNGTTFLTHALLPLMTTGSHIINISGTFESGAKGWLPYYVSKRAIEDFTVGLSEELHDAGISVNCISPSDVATETYKKFFPEYAADALDPKKIGEFVVDLCNRQPPVSGKIYIIKKDKEPYEGFHV